MGTKAAMARASGIAASSFLALIAGCSGILGLDETTERGPDASSDHDASLAPDAPSRRDASSREDGADRDAKAADAKSDTRDDEDVTESDASDAEPDAASTPVFTTAPSVLGLHQGQSLAVQVSVVRNGGLSGDVAVTFTGLPTGVTSTKGTIDADAGSTQVTVTAAPTAPVGPATVDLVANQTPAKTVQLVVYGAPGTIDETFQGGYVTDTSAGSKGTFNAVGIDAQGRIVAGGVSGAGGWLLDRFLANGMPDTTFTSAGLPTTGSLNGLAIDPNTNAIVCVGTSGPAGSVQFTVAVVDSASGHLDGSFNGSTPFSLTSVESQTSNAYGVTVGPNATFGVAGGYTQGASEAYLVPSMSEKSTPSAMNLGGYVGPEGSTAFRAVARDANGDLVAIGYDTTSQPAILLARFAAGKLDTTFGTTGTVTGGSFFCQGTSLAIRPQSGAIFVGGYDIGTDMGCFGQWLPDGGTQWTKQGTSGGGGLFTYAGAAPMPGDTMDRVYLVGSGGDSFGRSSELDRVKPDGTFDTMFGTTGSVQTSDPGSPPAFYYTLQAVAVQSDGLVIVAGQKTTTGTTATQAAVLGRFWP
jgi:hypothetical protein